MLYGRAMQVKDPDLLRTLLKSKGITARQLSRDMGWSSHSYMNRILAGQVASVSRGAALKIAGLLQVPVDLIFVAKASSEIRQNGKRGAA